MRMLMLKMIFVFVVLFSFPLNAAENSARNDSCEFISLLITDGSESGINKIEDMFSWNETLANKVTKLLTVLKDFKYLKGNAYVVADFDGIAEQHLLTLVTKKNGSQYVRFGFDQKEKKLHLISIEFKTDLNELIDKTGPFIQTPVHIEC